MPKYRLVLQKKNNEYIDIEWNKLYNCDINKLNNIVNFTGNYIEELDLKNVLLKHNLIHESEYNNKLAIIYKYNKKIKKLQYGITYHDDLKFFDPDYLKYYLKSKIYDYEFLTKLCNHYRNSYLQGNNINLIRNYINYVEMNNDLDNELINDINYRLEYFVNLEIYDYDKKTNSQKIKYKNLRDLAMFIAYDYRKKTKEDNQEIKLLREKPKEKVNKKTKKKDKNIEGQLSFKDMGW